MTTDTNTTSIAHAALQIQKPQIAELRDLLLNENCLQHRNRFVSGHALADCKGCSRRQKARKVWEQESKQLMLAALVSADEHDSLGTKGETEILSMVSRVCEALDMPIDL